MERKETIVLSRRLQRIKTELTEERFIKKYANKERLHEYINSLMAGKGVTVSELVERSGINRNYIYNILNGDRRSPSRDRVIAICIGLGAGFEETNRALELVRHAALYPRDERDVRIAVCINRGVNNVREVSEILAGHGLEPLGI